MRRPTPYAVPLGSAKAIRALFLLEEVERRGYRHPCQRTQNDGGGVEVLHPLSVWHKQE